MGVPPATKSLDRKSATTLSLPITSQTMKRNELSESFAYFSYVSGIV